MKELVSLPLLILFTWSASAQQVEDFRKVLSIVLENEHVQAKMTADQLELGSICLVTPGELKIQGRIDQNWTAGDAPRDDHAGDCLVLVSYKLDESRARLKFDYGQYKIKAKLRKVEQGWTSTSLTIRGKGKLLIDKEF